MELAGKGCLYAAVVFVAIIMAPLAGMADQDPATDGVPRVIPYQGYLDQNGTPVTTTGDGLWMRFSLYDGNAPGTLVYSEDLQVKVFRGRFSIVLGLNATPGELETVIAAADDIYLGITLLQDPGDETDDVALNGRQQITPVPYSFWSTASTDLKVAGSLTVDGPASATLFIGDLACPAGWWSAAGGRICYDPTIRDPAYMHTAITNCKEQQARVCTYMDMQQICGSGQNPFQGFTNGWYGDHATTTGGNADDEYLTWNNDTCDSNADGAAYTASAQILRYFCCK